MNKLNLYMIVLSVAVAGNAVAMDKVKALFNPKPQTTAGEMAAMLKNARQNAKGQFKQVKNEAMKGAVGETVALKNELDRTVNDFTDMGVEVGDIAQQLAKTADGVFEVVGDAIKDNKALAKNPKLKKRALGFISEARGILLPLAATVVTAYLGWTFLQMQGAPVKAKQTWFKWGTDKVGGVYLRTKLAQLFGGSQPAAPVAQPDVEQEQPVVAQQPVQQQMVQLKEDWYTGNVCDMNREPLRNPVDQQPSLVKMHSSQMQFVGQEGDIAWYYGPVYGADNQQLAYADGTQLIRYMAIALKDHVVQQPVAQQQPAVVQQEQPKGFFAKLWSYLPKAI